MADVESPTTPPAVPPPPAADKPKTKPWVVVLAVIGGLVVVGWLFNVMSASGSGGWKEAGTVSVDEDRFASFGFTASEPVNVALSIAVNSGPNVDFYVMDDINFQSYQDGGSFIHQSQCSRAPVNAGTWACGLPAGTWRFVIDNTDAGDTAPPFNAANDSAVVQYSFTAN